MVTWDEVRTWFEIDGGLRDILVRDTVEADWDRLFEAVTEWGYQATWSVGGELIAAPESASAALSDPEPLLLSIQVGPACVNLHFFSVDEIEMDIDPREIQTPSAFEQIQSFISRPQCCKPDRYAAVIRLFRVRMKSRWIGKLLDMVSTSLPAGRVSRAA